MKSAQCISGLLAGAALAAAGIAGAGGNGPVLKRAPAHNPGGVINREAGNGPVLKRAPGRGPGGAVKRGPGLSTPFSFVPRCITGFSVVSRSEDSYFATWMCEGRKPRCIPQAQIAITTPQYIQNPNDPLGGHYGNDPFSYECMIDNSGLMEPAVPDFPGIAGAVGNDQTQDPEVSAVNQAMLQQGAAIAQGGVVNKRGPITTPRCTTGFTVTGIDRATGSTGTYLAWTCESRRIRCLPKGDLYKPWPPAPENGWDSFHYRCSFHKQ